MRSFTGICNWTGSFKRSVRAEGTEEMPIFTEQKKEHLREYTTG
jgi:hypothetical protein